jgi:hypothetical protein
MFPRTAVIACALLSACVGHDGQGKRQPESDLNGSAAVARPVGVHLTSEFLPGQALLRISHPQALVPSLNIHARSWGCDRLAELRFTDPVAKPGSERRVSFLEEKGDVDEWFVPGEDRLEQGFTISKLPACSAAEGTLTIELLTSPGWRTDVSDDGARAAFRDSSGAVINYTDASARDRVGRLLPTKIVRLGEALGLQVDVRGAALPLVVDPLAWVEQQKLSASTGVASDNFGTSVAVSGDALAIGTPLDDTKGDAAGAIYPFLRAGVTWSQQAKIVASDGQAGDAFGFCAATNGTYLAVGAPYDDDGGTDAGSVYVFSRTGSTWGGQKKIVAADAQASAELGSAVALDGTTLLIGASVDSQLAAGAGAAYVYVVSGGNWTLQKKLMAVDAGADAGDVFGTSVAISGDTAIVGAPYDSDVAAYAGAAYVFVRTGTSWSQQAKLVADDAAASALAGQSVSLSGDSAVVGAYGDATKGASAGAAYVWTRTGTTWTKQQKLYASDAAVSAQFGYSASIVGNALAIGANGDSGGKGAAYLFVRSGLNWAQAPKLQASDSAANAAYGWSLSLDGDTLAVGAPSAKVGANVGQGEAYVASLADGSACGVDSDCKGGHCVEGVCCNTVCAGICTSCLASRKASGADGVCGNAKIDTDPRNVCGAQAASTCGLTGNCNGAGACALFANGTECKAAACPTATSADPADDCDGSGTCKATAVVACQRGYLCAAGACNTSCAGNGDCDGTRSFVCDDSHKCTVPQAGACQVNLDCQTGHCADGVCCDTACTDKCTSCLAAQKGSGADGVCGPISADTDPKNQCAPAPATDPNAVCGADGFCDGQGSCRSYAIPQTPCGDTTCTDATGTAAGTVAVTGQLCDGQGNCGANTASCDAYVCSGSACGTSCTKDTDCADGAFCAGTSKCQVKLDGGKSCGGANECASGFCTDGVCCNGACGGQCEYCNADPTSAGTCVPVQGLPQNGRPACAAAPTDQPCLAAVCDGETTDSCAGFAGSQVVCQDASCADGKATGTARCDGAGSCSVDKPVDCGAFKCGPTECLTACQSDTDCADGNSCVEGVCSSGARCSDDLTSLIATDGSAQNCSPFLCQGQACLKNCSSSSDCADGFVCNPNDKNCEAITASPQQDSNCSCRAVGTSSTPARNRLWLGLLVLGCAVARGRRQSSRPRRAK